MHVIWESHRRTHHASRWALHSCTAQIPACWTTKHCPYRSTTMQTGIAHSDFQSTDTRKSSSYTSLASPLLARRSLCFPSGENILLLPILSPLSLTSLSLCSWPEVLPFAYREQYTVNFHLQLWDAYEAFLLPTQPHTWDFAHPDPLISVTRESIRKPCTSLYSSTCSHCLLLHKVESARGSHWLLDTDKAN